MDAAEAERIPVVGSRKNIAGDATAKEFLAVSQLLFGPPSNLRRPEW